MKVRDTVYSCIKFNQLPKAHVFEGQITKIDHEKPICDLGSGESCCGRIENDDYTREKVVFGCKMLKEALLACIKVDAPICASCEEHLFKLFQEKYRDKS